MRWRPPYLAEGAEAEMILPRLVDQSRPYGVTLEVDAATQTAKLRLQAARNGGSVLQRLVRNRAAPALASP